MVPTARFASFWVHPADVYKAENNRSNADLLPKRHEPFKKNRSKPRRKDGIHPFKHIERGIERTGHLAWL
jgi:hypothetical protein